MRIISFLFLMIIATASCTNNPNSERAEKNYERAKENLADTEKKNPTKFLFAAGDKKKNLIGQTVVKGSITNTAKMITFKDIDVKITFYSKTGTLLEEDHEKVYENITPGTTLKFKTKFFTPKGTDSLALQVVDARY